MLVGCPTEFFTAYAPKWWEAAWHGSAGGMHVQKQFWMKLSIHSAISEPLQQNQIENKLKVPIGWNMRINRIEHNPREIKATVRRDEPVDFYPWLVWSRLSFMDLMLRKVSEASPPPSQHTSTVRMLPRPLERAPCAEATVMAVQQMTNDRWQHKTLLADREIV